MDLVLRAALFALVAVQVLRAAVLARRRPDVARPVRRALRWWMWALAPVVLAVVGVSAGLLVEVPGFDWGWGRLVGVDSNVVLAPVTAAGQPSGSAVVSVLTLAGALMFLAVLAYAMPLFTLAEERIFRRGLEAGGVVRWLRATVGFGLVHVVMGIPVGVALALSWGGAAFALVYLRGWRQDRAEAEPQLREGGPTGGSIGPTGATGEAGSAVAVAAALVGQESADRACSTSAAFHMAYNLQILVILAVVLVLGL